MEQALDRRRLHIDISLFFNQFEPPSESRTLERRIGSEDEVDRLRRGGYSPSKVERELSLHKLNAANEAGGALLLQVGSGSDQSSSIRQVGRAITHLHVTPFSLTSHRHMMLSMLPIRSQCSNPSSF